MMSIVVVESDAPAESEAVQPEALPLPLHGLEPDDGESAPPGSFLYPLAGVTLALATAALAYGGLLYVLKRAGIHLPR